MGLRGLVYFVGTHTRSTVPRGRSAAALGADATVAQILFTSEVNRVGKGLTIIIYNGRISTQRVSVALRVDWCHGCVCGCALPSASKRVCV